MKTLAKILIALCLYSYVSISLADNSSIGNIIVASSGDISNSGNWGGVVFRR